MVTGERPSQTATMRKPTGLAATAAVLRDLEERCAVPEERLRLVADAMAVEMRAGLAAHDGDVGSSLKMLVTYVDSLPSG